MYWNQLHHLCLQFLTIRLKILPKFGTKAYWCDHELDLHYSASSSAATTEEYSEFLSSSQISDAGDELTAMPVAATSQQHDKSSNINSMIQMASFFEQQADRISYNRDDGPPCPSEPQTPTADR